MTMTTVDPQGRRDAEGFLAKVIRGGLVRRATVTLGALMVVSGCAGTQPTPTQGIVPSLAPSGAPSLAPAVAPSPAPSLAPSVAPSPAPSLAPSVAASVSPSPAARGTATFMVIARDLSFTPRQLTADSGSAISLGIHNEGRIVHNLTIDELGVQLVVSPGQTKSIDLTDVPAGTYTYYCSVSGHRQAGMFGTLTVE